jgi:hypothetical protein
MLNMMLNMMLSMMLTMIMSINIMYLLYEGMDWSGL